MATIYNSAPKGAWNGRQGGLPILFRPVEHPRTMDHAYLPTKGHFLALCYRTIDPARYGILFESAHALLAGLDRTIEMAHAIYRGKHWSVHLDQNGLKLDEDRAFGAMNLKRAFDQVFMLCENDFGAAGEFVGQDVKALRTQKDDVATRHLSNRRKIFLDLVEVVRKVDSKKKHCARRGITRSWSTTSSPASWERPEALPRIHR
jgi:hypothetical protein